MSLQLAFRVHAVVQAVFATVPLDGADLLTCVIVSSFVFWAVDAESWFGVLSCARCVLATRFLLTVEIRTYPANL